ncbi:MAG: energy-coupling factor transporter ATPase [Clostridiales bacterium]|nr:energy-coupling factor transporter ATPase [Clostridiales bacterium]
MSIKVRNLRYVYNAGMPGETVALDDVSFDVPDGIVLGVIGHTGSGKSTLLQHLNGLLKPESGEIYIDGECITDGKARMTEMRRRVGLVFQYPEYQLFEETVSKDVAFGPKNLGLDEEETEKRVRMAIELVGLDYDEIKDKSPFDLSGGMKRRVAIAGVIAMEPKVLILDEPTAGLDPSAHRDILSMIRRIHDEMGIILIFVSHNMGDVASMSDRVLVMSGGRIVLDGSPEEVFSHAEELDEMGLALPPARQIMMDIAGRVPGLKSDALTIEEAASDIRGFIR